MKIKICYVIYETQDFDTTSDTYGEWFLTYQQFFGEDVANAFLEQSQDVREAKMAGKTVIGPLRHV